MIGSRFNNRRINGTISVEFALRGGQKSPNEPKGSEDWAVDHLFGQGSLSSFLLSFFIASGTQGPLADQMTIFRGDQAENDMDWIAGNVSNHERACVIKKKKKS